MKICTWSDARELFPELPELPKRVGKLYLATSGELLKVGYSKAPERRVSVMNGRATREQFRAVHGFDPGVAEIQVLIADCGHEHEWAVHDLLKNESRKGEWFDGYMARALVGLLFGAGSECRGTIIHNEGQRQLRTICAERGASKRIATALKINPAQISNWKNQGTKPEARFRVRLEEQFGIPIHAWDLDPAKGAA